MKCDNCRFYYSESASLDYPYPWEGCMKQHWDGGGPMDCPDDTEGDSIDPWADCLDFEQTDKINH